MTFPTKWKNNPNVPNHQPVIYHDSHMAPGDKGGSPGLSRRWRNTSPWLGRDMKASHCWDEVLDYIQEFNIPAANFQNTLAR